jgi:hypothetical protein
VKTITNRSPIRILIVIDQPKRDSIIAEKICHAASLGGHVATITSAFECVEKALLIRPDVLIVGNADTYHSLYIKLLRPIIKMIVSIPTEQYLTTSRYSENYNQQWIDYISEGHKTGLKPAYSYTDIILTWGNCQRLAISRVMKNSIPVEAIGPIRLPNISSRKNQCIGILLDNEDPTPSKLRADMDHRWFGEDKLKTQDILILSKHFELSMLLTIKYLGENFPDEKFILRPRFTLKSESSLISLKYYLDKYLKDYEIDVTNNLEKIISSSYLILSGNTTASIECQVLGTPVVNVLKLFNSEYIDSDRISLIAGSLYPYRFAHMPDNGDQLVNIVSQAKKGELLVSPSLEEFMKHVLFTFGYNPKLSPTKPEELIIEFLVDGCTANPEKKSELIHEDRKKLINLCGKYNIIWKRYPVSLIENLLQSSGIHYRIVFNFFRVIKLTEYLAKKLVKRILKLLPIAAYKSH